MKRIVLSIALLLALCGCDHAIEVPPGSNPPPGNQPPPSEPPPPDPPGVDYGPAGAPPQLGASASFAVLAATGVFGSGDQLTIAGDVGSSPVGKISGLPESQPNPGTRHEGDAGATVALVAALAAYNDLGGRACNASFDDELGGRTLVPGVHCADRNAKLEGTVTLDARNNPDAVFVIKVHALECRSRSVVALVNGAQAKNVFWRCSGDVTIDSNSSFAGTVIASSGIACLQKTSVRGRLISLNEWVTLSNCSVTLP